MLITVIATSMLFCINLFGAGGAEVPRQLSNDEQLDAANNNARQKTFSSQYSDAQNNNVASKLSPHSHSTSSSMSQVPTPAGQKCAGDGIEIMPYTDFVRSRTSRGLPAPRGVVVRRNGRHVLVPQYVVQHHRQHRAHVRSLRRHGYESEDGRIAGRHHGGHGYESDQYRSIAGGHHHRRAAAGHGYESDIGYRSDLAGGYSSSKPAPHHTAAYPNSSVYSSDFGDSRDWHYGSDRDVRGQKVSSSSSFISQPGRNIPLFERDVQETIAEEVIDSEGQPSEQSQMFQGNKWPLSVRVHAHNRFADHYGGNQTAAYPYEFERRHNKVSSRRRNFEPIEL